MVAIRRFFFRLVSFFRFDRAESDLARELNTHLQLLEDRFIAEGMSADEARFAARRAFGGRVEQIKAQQRDTRSFRFLDELWLDLTLGARMLVNHPGLTLVAVFAISHGHRWRRGLSGVFQRHDAPDAARQGRRSRGRHLQLGRCQQHRRPLGADSRRLLRNIFARSATQLGVGIVLGVGAAVTLHAASGGTLLGAEAAVVLPAMALVMLAVGLLASVGPARRGLRIHPTQALREE